MTAPVVAALHILSQFWLEEIRSDDVEIIAALPELAQTLPNFDSATLTELAVEYQRLFGFNLSPYESVFIDPEARASNSSPKWSGAPVRASGGGLHSPC